MNKITAMDNLSHVCAKISFLKEALVVEYEGPLTQTARLGLQDFFNDIIDDIEAISEAIDKTRSKTHLSAPEDL